MEIQIIALLCEGPHDVAFFGRILKTIGFKGNEKLKIGEFPSPINDLMIREVSKSNIDDLNLQEVRQSLLPSITLIRENTFLFIYSLNGDKKDILRRKLFQDFLLFIPEEGEIPRISTDTKLSVLYCFDADKKGVAERVLEINKDRAFLNFQNMFESGSKIIIEKEIKHGFYIFTGYDNNTGKLEDVLIPLMQIGNEAIFEAAMNYLDCYYDMNRGKKSDYDKDKSTIGIACQLQKSGSSNVVCIGQTDYITDEKILLNIKCLEIISYIEDFISFKS